MRLAFSTNAYLKWPLDRALKSIASLGYTGVELMADVPHAWPAGLLDEQKQAIRDALAETDLAISNINAFMMNAVADPRQPYWHPSWTDPDPHYRAIRREHTKRALRLAAEIGAPHITTEPGGPHFAGQSRDEALELFVQELTPCLEIAEEVGVGLLIEPEPELLVERFDQYLEVIDRLDSPVVRLNFDIGHAYCVGEDPQAHVARMAGHTAHYHLEDIAVTRVHQHLVPGRGAIDWHATLGVIRQTGYDGWLTVELYPYADDPEQAAREAYEFLAPLVLV
ncbi:sugar phosphate isomerase/epimerase family protein [Botrimarina hoheduenensis]|uniref:D-tagatose 3-epimerase n=1 Tax=Botrimarina hoheduenensis TaxID=2528000 RepID=A0A5C5VXX2_9BACT|nr:sugar phosphate isomerase/epimerase family protein [Botrimarina hoheduenensis]TWT42845.1 D-tagatose 3-epimerase [Botrimarina hoheduenensis]